MLELTHPFLCGLAVAWLQRPSSRKGPGCQVALSETQNHLSREVPDAIGWRALAYGGMGSTVVEVKVSRADFLADRKKPHRRDPSRGLGRFRYYLAPEGLIDPAELPPRWGLLEVNARGHLAVRCGHVLCRGEELEAWAHPEYRVDAEMSLLTLALARVGDPQEVQQRLREASNQVARLIRVLEHERASYARLSERTAQLHRRVAELEDCLAQRDSLKP